MQSNLIDLSSRAGVCMALMALVSVLALPAPANAQSQRGWLDQFADGTHDLFPPTNQPAVVDEFNLGPPWQFNRREPSPGQLYNGYTDPHSIYRHHGPGTGTTHHYEGPYRHHDMGHAYYDDSNSMKRFHGLGSGGAERRGRYEYHLYYLDRLRREGFIYGGGCGTNRGPALMPSDSSAPHAPAAPARVAPLRPPVFFYEPPGSDDVETIPLDEIPHRNWAILNDGDVKTAIFMFAVEALRDQESVDARVGFAIASAIYGKYDRAATSIRQALELDSYALSQNEVSQVIHDRVRTAATKLRAVFDESQSTTASVQDANDAAIIRSRQIEEQSHLLILLASLYLVGGETEQARLVLLELDELRPDDPTALQLARSMNNEALELAKTDGEDLMALLSSFQVALSR